MKKSKIILITLFTINSFIEAQNSFYKIFEGPYGQCGWDVSETRDKGYIIVGQTKTLQNKDDIYVVKTNHSGDTIWTRLIGENQYDYGYSVRQTSDNGYIIAGSTSNPVTGEQYMSLIKLNDSGEVLWAKTYGGSQNNAGGHVEITDDNGFIVLSYNYLRRTDSDGDTLWTKILDSGPSSRSYLCLCITSDGGYVIAGNGLHGFLMKTNSFGDTVWSKTYDYYAMSSLESVKEVPGGGYIVAGTAYNYLPTGPYQSDLLVIKTDNSGDTIWTKTFGNNISYDYGYSVDNTVDSGFIVSGMLAGDIYLVKINSMGDTIWTKTYDLSEQEYGHSVKQASDSGYIVTGRFEYVFFDGHIFLIKTDKDGNVTGLPQKQPPSFISKGNNIGLQVYPNPGFDILNIQRNENSEVLIEIYDINGINIYRKRLRDYSVKIDISEYPAGPYIVKLVSNSNIVTRLIIKSKCY